jgi:hypothetical protein
MRSKATARLLCAETANRSFAKSCGISDELSKRIDAVWRFDQYIANAAEDGDLRTFWSELKVQELANVRRLKQLIAEHIEKKCF